MSQDHQISLVSGWHIVPFNFDDYDRIHEKLLKSPRFGKMTCPFGKTVFENIRDSFFDEGGAGRGRNYFRRSRPFHDNLGSYFLCRFAEDEPLAIDASFLGGDGENRSCRIGVDQAGIFIFHTGVGFFFYHYWYDHVLSEDMIVIQRYLRLYRLYSDQIAFRLKYVSGFLPDAPGADGGAEPADAARYMIGVTDYGSEAGEVSPGAGASSETFSLGLWLAGIFREILPWIRYQMSARIVLPVRLPEGNVPQSEAEHAPGKPSGGGNATATLPAIVLNFVYCCYPGGDVIDRKELCATAYYIANGFNRSFRLSESIEKRMLSPYENMVCSSSQNGCAICASYDSSNEKFFLRNFARNLHNSYFLFYILINYQKFTLIGFSNSLYRDFSDTCEIRSLSLERLVSHSGRINMFIMNSINPSVSYNDHHNYFYQYLFKRLEIRRDIEFLSMGVESLHQYLRNVKDDRDKKTAGKISKSLAALSLLVVFSALIDSFNFIDEASKYFINEASKYFKDKNVVSLSDEALLWAHVCVIALIAAVGLYTFTLLMKLQITELFRKVMKLFSGRP